MQIYLTEHMKVERVESGVAVVTLRIPIEYLDSLLALADHLISCARFLKTRSRVALATDAANSPGHAALVLAARAAAVLSDALDGFQRCRVSGSGSAWGAGRAFKLVICSQSVTRSQTENCGTSDKMPCPVLKSLLGVSL